MILMTNHPLTPGTDKSASSAVLELIPQLLPALIHDSHQVPSQLCPLWSSRAPTLPRPHPAASPIPLSRKGNIFPGAASIHYHKVASLGLQLIIHLSLEDGCSVPPEFLNIHGQGKAAGPWGRSGIHLWCSRDPIPGWNHLEQAGHSLEKGKNFWV